jgi:hypothetical protein
MRGQAAHGRPYTQNGPIISMEKSRRTTISLALVVLICFFLPWIQISCGASEGSLSGVDLARDGHNGLWLIPLLMLAVLFLGIARGWKEKRELSAIVTLVGGAG